MGSEKQPTIIKKYANRRLYNTGTSAYVTLEDLASMVKKGDDFVVFDAKSGEEITRSVLTQIIFEQEGKGDQSLLPITFLRQLIRFYGDSMQMLVPSYLEFTIDRLTSELEKFRKQVSEGLAETPLGASALGASPSGASPLGASPLGASPLGASAAGASPFDAAALAASPLGTQTRQLFGPLEEQARKNMAIFSQALSMFNPFAAAQGASSSQPPMPEPASHKPEGGPPAEPKAEPRNDLDEMKRQLDELQKKIEGMIPKG